MSKNSNLSFSASKDYAGQLLIANDPDVVAEVNEDIEAKFDVEWRPLGEDGNNYSTVHNQGTSPMAAFTELPLNSADAQMLKFYEGSADSDIGPMEYTSMKEAVKTDWVDPDDATIEIIADGYKPRDGNLLNLIVRDNGKGKARDEFDDFVSTHEPGLKKQKYGFCQGQYGMGSTGVLKFCGNVEEEFNKRCFKFIASASSDDQGKWSWTLIRDNPEKSQFEYLTINRNFPIFDGAFGKELTEKFVDTYPDEYEISRTTLPDPQKFGSFVKVYDYNTNATRSIISGYTGFRRKLERFLVDSPFPIRLTDIRYDVKVRQTETQGFLPTLRDGREHLLKGEEHIHIETDSETLGERDAHVLLFKSNEELEEVETTDRGKNTFVAGSTKHKDAVSPTGIQRDHAVMLTVNGQTHGSKTQFFLEKLGYSKVAEDTVVIVEFDDLANLGMVKMFQPSRDKLADSPQTQKFISGLKEGLSNSDLLSEEEERRRATRGSTEEHIDTETFEEYLERHPDIANYIQSGDKVSASYLRPSGDEFIEEEENNQSSPEALDGDGSTGRSEPPMLPTYLRPIYEYDPDGDHNYWDDELGYMPVEISVNRHGKIRFETDAQNDYLSRDVLSGSLNIWPSSRFSSAELQDGLLTLTIQPEENAKVGEDFALAVELTRPDPTECDFIDDPEEAFPNEGGDREPGSGVAADGGEMNASPLTSSFNVEYTEPEEKNPHPTSPKTKGENSGREGEGSGDSDGNDIDGDKSGANDGKPAGEITFDIPNIERVYEENWRVDDAGNPIDEENFDSEEAERFDENIFLRIDPSRDGTISGLTITVNMDAAPLRRFIINQNIKENRKEFVERRYEIAVVFYAISEYRELVQAYGESLEGSQIMTTSIIEHSINGIGQTLLPTIIPEELLEQISD